MKRRNRERNSLLKEKACERERGRHNKEQKASRVNREEERKKGGTWKYVERNESISS